MTYLFRTILFAPFVYFIYLLFAGHIGADPAKFLNHRMGQVGLYYLTLNFLIGAALAYSIRFPKYARFLLQNRRWLGVVTFIYLFLHFLLYLTMEGFEGQAYTQIYGKLYLALGFAALLILSALAMTSNNFSVRYIGARRWKSLHRLSYAACALITAHVMLIEKADLVFYGIFFALLWLIQLPRLFRR